MEIAWSCVKDGAHIARKNRTEMDSWERKEKGEPKNNIEENGNGRDEECWYWLRESTILAQDDRSSVLEGPRWGPMYHGHYGIEWVKLMSLK